MYSVLRTLLASPDCPVVESFELPERPARYGPVPQFLSDSSVGSILEQQELWSHQAEALDALGSGENVVIATGTASGKSRIFQSLAFHRISENPSSRVVVFYPLRALVEDQVRSWREMALQLGLQEDTVGLIYGGIPAKQREATLRQARIVVMTPDVCQAWLMHRLATPDIKNFVRDLSIVVLDEAHALEGVFGSNVALLIRRLVAAHNLLGSDGDHPPLQFVGATATIANPGEHMKLLTGRDFTVIDQAADGSPHHTRLIAHVACESGEELSVARDLQQRVLADGANGSFITFVDSRKNVETLAMATAQDVANLSADEKVVSYRAGFDTEERRRIEKQLRDGTHRGVVSTSALELGIDFPHLRVGFNVGVPPTRKAYRQRLGRVGRHGPGAFVLIGPDDAFTRYGTSFTEYDAMSVEPSYLYLDNRFMQFAHARCLVDELGALGGSRTLPSHVAWPSGFRETFGAARPGGDIPLEFDDIARLGSDAPHYNYPLRNIGETNYKIKQRADSDEIGEINQAQALRECYPGATYLHRMQRYTVSAWNPSPHDPFIRVRANKFRGMTKPRIITSITAGVHRGEITGQNIIITENGLLAECSMVVHERVEGYTDSSGIFRPYTELQEKNPNMRMRSRYFRTTGVLFHLDNDLFQDVGNRSIFVDRLKDTFLREYSILPQDVGSAATNIGMKGQDGTTRRGKSIVVFDQTYGSLRLTEKLYDNFLHVLERIISGVKDDEHELLATCQTIQNELLQGVESLASHMTEYPPLASSGNYLQVFAEGSHVFKRDAGTIGIDVEVVEPTIRDGELHYRVKTLQRPGHPEVRSYYAASLVEPSADADRWEYAWWNPETETYVAEPDETD